MSDFCIGEEHGHHAHRQQVRLGSPWSELRGGRLVRPTAAWYRRHETWAIWEKNCKRWWCFMNIGLWYIVMVMLRWNIFVTEFLNELEQNWESEEAWGLMWGFKRVWAARIATSDWGQVFWALESGMFWDPEKCQPFNAQGLRSWTEWIGCLSAAVAHWQS